MKLIARCRSGWPAARRAAWSTAARSRMTRTMNPSISIVRPVAIAASTIPLIEVWMPGIRGRNRHSYSISSPVFSSTIGW